MNETDQKQAELLSDYVLAEDQRMAAIHEAGHAVVNCLLRVPFRRVRLFDFEKYIQEDGPSLGNENIIDANPVRPDDLTRKRARHYVMASLAGPIAEGLKAAGMWPDDYHSDGRKADMNSVAVLLEVHGLVLRPLQVQTVEILVRTWECVEAVAKELLVRKNMSRGLPRSPPDPAEEPQVFWARFLRADSL
jgi:hypothetical protein